MVRMSIRAYYSGQVSSFLSDQPERILGVLTSEHHHSLEEPQRWAWLRQISILQVALAHVPNARLFLEFYIPRVGKRADAVLITSNMVFVIEFKVGATAHAASAFDQVEDYALDLKNFHEGSHSVAIVPVLVSTRAESQELRRLTLAPDLVAAPMAANEADLASLIQDVCDAFKAPSFDLAEWMAKGYRPTPTIVEAAEALYRDHSVRDISRSDAGAKNLQETSTAVIDVINRARQHSSKAICFITGVPGSGKT